jgi:N-acyl homoserine lactone hydrolase
MRIHAIRTGSVRIKTAHREGHGSRSLRLLRILTDRNWTEWLPTFAWAIEHDEGVIVVDTGQASHLLLEHGRSLNPLLRWEFLFRIEPGVEVGPQLRALGIGPRDVKRVVLTHLHCDHDGGLRHFPETEIWVAHGELQKAQGLIGRIRGYSWSPARSTGSARTQQFPVRRCPLTERTRHVCEERELHAR